MIRLLLLLSFCWTCQARADLYRWIDPESGSVKFSSYPPPWYGDPAKERRAPRVEVIPGRASAPPPAAKPEAEAPPERKPAAGPAERVSPRPAGPGEEDPEKPAARSVDRAPDRAAEISTPRRP